MINPALNPPPARLNEFTEELLRLCKADTARLGIRVRLRKGFARVFYNSEGYFCSSMNRHKWGLDGLSKVSTYDDMAELEE